MTVDGDPEQQLPMATVDQVEGGRIATEHLLAAGHATVWHVAGPTDWFDAAGRAAGWAAALRAAGAEVPPVMAADWSADAGYRAGELMARMPEVTAVFAANDALATGLLHAFHDRGRRVLATSASSGSTTCPSRRT